MALNSKVKAVILVDLQADFTEFYKGALPVPGTDLEYLRKVEEAVRSLKNEGLLIVASQDWHPPDHISFFTNHLGKRPYEEIVIGDRKQILWPPHCVQDTKGAEIVVDTRLIDWVVKKGQNPLYDSYSAFCDDGGFETGLELFLKERGIGELIIFGLATDYCVLATVTDAKARGYEVCFLDELSKGVDPVTAKEAIDKMERMGVRVYRSLADLK
ncbi:MAG: isochorismatase family protein [Desulfobacterota bacterium]|nr:isochorismatase family protein [Thermodesulfobacteriota bacterium]MDW8002803.1 isochorismatase family protein [Deltaproteobacteria bacterium]